MQRMIYYWIYWWQKYKSLIQEQEEKEENLYALQVLQNGLYWSAENHKVKQVQNFLTWNTITSFYIAVYHWISEKQTC